MKSSNPSVQNFFFTVIQNNSTLVGIELYLTKYNFSPELSSISSFREVSNSNVIFEPEL